MAKTIFFSIPATGHMNPSLPVIRELIKRGEEVICANTDEYREKIESTGARFVSYPGIDAMAKLIQEDAGEGNIPRNMRDLVRLIAILTPFALDLIGREKPDYVIFDTLARWGKLAATQHHLPGISLSSTFIIGDGVFPPFPLPLLIDTLGKMVRVLPSYLVDAMKMTLQQRIFPGFLTDSVMSTGDMTIVFTSRDFQLDGEKLPSKYKFVGTSIAPRLHDAEFPFEQLTGSPLIYISPGTLVNDAEFVKQSFRAFADFEGQFIVSTGRTLRIEAVGEIPDNFIVRSSVPQLEILERVDAFITHGGLNSVHESLVYGVPMMIFPQQFEQVIVALEVEKQGAGIAPVTFPPFNVVTAEMLRDGLRELLSSGHYADNAKRLGQTLKDAGGYQRAVDEILQFVAE